MQIEGGKREPFLSCTGAIKAGELGILAVVLGNAMHSTYGRTMMQCMSKTKEPAAYGSRSLCLRAGVELLNIS